MTPSSGQRREVLQAQLRQVCALRAALVVRLQAAEDAQHCIEQEIAELVDTV